MKTGLDLVVVNHNTPLDLSEFLSSLRSFDIQMPHTLFIVNTGVLSGDRKLVRDWRRRLEICYIEFEENVGYNVACNRAGSLGDREVIAFFNADVRLTEGALDQCHAALMGREDWGVLGPRQVDDRGRVTAGGIIGTRAAPRHRGWKDRDSSRYADILEDCPTVSGAALFAKRALWDELTACPEFRRMGDAEGAFLQAKHYWGETYLCYHAIEHGWKCVFYGPVEVQHLWHKASPMGGQAELWAREDQDLFRQACAVHSIECD